MRFEMDDMDRRLLRLLQEDASLPISELAERVGLSQSPCWRRINRMEKAGVIKGRVAVLDPEKLDLGTTIFAQVRLSSQGHRAIVEFENAIRAIPEVVDCYTVLGQIDFLLRVVTHDVHGYEEFIRAHLFNMPHVLEVHSMVAISAIKERAPLPI